MTCCKGNSALHVKVNMSTRDSGRDARRRRNCRSYAVTMRIPRNIELDTLEVFGVITFTLLWIIFEVHMPDKDPKLAALRQQGTLNPRPGRVSDALFVKDSFFDSRDLVQVKYEMLRRV